MTARLQQHKVELVREARFRHSQNQGFLADFFALLCCHRVVGTFLLAQIESLN